MALGERQKDGDGQLAVDATRMREQTGPPVTADDRRGCDRVDDRGGAVVLGLADPAVRARAPQHVGRAEDVAAPELALEGGLPRLVRQLSLFTKRSMRSQASSIRSIDAA